MIHQHTVADTEALFALLDEEAPQEHHHPRASALGLAALGFSSPATTRNVREHVGGCQACQDGTTEVMLVTLTVGVDRQKFTRETGVRISLVTMYRSCRRDRN